MKWSGRSDKPFRRGAGVKENMKALRNYFRFLGSWPGVRPRLAVVIVLSVLCALLDGIGIGLLMPLFHQLQASTPGSDPTGGLLVRGVTRLLSLIGLQATLPILLGAGAVVFIGRSLMNYFRQMMIAHVQYGLDESMQARLFRHLTTFDLAFFHRSRLGDLSNTLLTEIRRVSYSVYVGSEMVSAFSLMAIYASVQLVVSWAMTLGALALLGVAGYFLRPRGAYRLGLDQTNKNAELQTIAVESLGAMRELKGLGLEGRVQKRFQEVAGTLRGINVRLTFLAVWFMFLFQTVVFLVLAGLIFFGARRIDISFPALLVFLLAMQRMAPQVQTFVNLRHWWIGALPALEKVESLMAETQEKKAAVGSGPRPFVGLEKAIEFRDVSFRYGDRDGDVLAGVTLSIPRGSCVAIVGSSGAGKSTMLDLVARFYDPTGGTVLVDGRDLREFDLAGWRSALGLVSQDTFLFNDTLENNIRFGRRDATPEEVRHAARAAYADGFIRQMPQGYATETGDRGVRLSGGQRQRIALARAILKRPQVLLLDEATSDLDAESESYIQRAIESLRGRCTVISVAHRLASVKTADQIVVLERGRVAEQGTAEGLLAGGGRYAQLHALQWQGDSPS